MLPDSIHRDSGCQWVLLARHPLSKLEAAALAVRETWRPIPHYCFDETARNFFPSVWAFPRMLIWISAGDSISRTEKALGGSGRLNSRRSIRLLTSASSFSRAPTELGTGSFPSFTLSIAVVEPGAVPADFFRRSISAVNVFRFARRGVISTANSSRFCARTRSCSLRERSAIHVAEHAVDAPVQGLCTRENSANSVELFRRTGSNLLIAATSASGSSSRRRFANHVCLHDPTHPYGAVLYRMRPLMATGRARGTPWRLIAPVFQHRFPPVKGRPQFVL